MVPAGGGDVFDGVNSVKAGKRSLDRTADGERCMGAGVHGSKQVTRRVFRIRFRLPIRRGRMDDERQDGAQSTRPRAAADEFVREYAWSSRNTRSRESQWKAWFMFCQEDG